MLFSGEDSLAVHTVAAAAHTVVMDIARKRGQTPYEESLKKALRQMIGKPPSNSDQSYLSDLFRKHLKQPANFLKHADKDTEESLDKDSLETDHLLLASCVTHGELGLKHTPEMRAFIRWHLAVYPHEDGDDIQTGAGYIHDLSRAYQLQCGDFLLTQYRASS